MLHCNRRDLIIGGMTATAGLLLPQLALASREKPKAQREVRSLSFISTHTGARGNFTYWEKGEYIGDGLLEISHFLRDFRTGEEKLIDQFLLDQLYLLQYFTDSSRPYQVISGYRSKKTNEMLFRQTKGVDKNSFHMQGRAIDIRLSDVDLRHLHKAALSLKAGGVGYYPASGFIHVDSGPVRSWDFRS